MGGILQNREGGLQQREPPIRLCPTQYSHHSSLPMLHRSMDPTPGEPLVISTPSPDQRGNGASSSSSDRPASSSTLPLRHPPEVCWKELVLNACPTWEEILLLRPLLGLTTKVGE